MSGRRERAWLAALHPFRWREAVLGAPAMALLVLAGAALGHPIEAAVASGAAFAVGFGAAREWRQHRFAAMTAATIGMALAAFIGSWAGQTPAVLLAVAAAAAAGCAALALIDETLWWVTLQMAIALFVAGAYPGGLHQAADRALLVLGGGAVQVATTLAVKLLLPPPPPLVPAEITPSDRALLPSHMARAALCVAASLAAAHALGIANGYWAPMTALLVLKPRLHETHARGLARLGGTLLGCALATLVAAACAHRLVPLTLAMTLAAGTAFALQKAHYASLTAAITATVVLLLSLGQASAWDNAAHRLAATLLGGGIALLVARLVPHSALRLGAGTDRVGR